MVGAETIDCAVCPSGRNCSKGEIGPVGKLRYEQLNDERVIADSFGLQSLLNEGFRPPLASEQTLDERWLKNAHSQASRILKRSAS
jgi:hypothetical protein